MANINSKNTKAQILKAYEELEREKKQVENALKTKETALDKMNKELVKLKSVKTPPPPAAKEKTIVKVIEGGSKPENIEGIIGILDGIDKGAGKAISSISNQLTIEAESLAELTAQIDQKTEELEKLYGIKTKNGTLGKIIEDYEASQKKFETEFADQKREATEALAEKKVNWQKEQQKYQEADKEKRGQNTQSFEREVEEYEYDLEHARTQEDDVYEQKKKKLQEDLEMLEKEKEKLWEEKEKELVKHEEEYATYQQKFEEIPAKIEKEIKKAEAEGKAIIERDAKVKADLQAKEIESNKQIFELKINSLDKVIQNQQHQIDSLSKQLESALQQAQQLAIKAIEGSANLDKFNAVKDIANELAKNQTKGK